MNSFNHYSLGSIGEWFYSHVLGIRRASGSAAFERLDMRPAVNRAVGSAHGSFDSPRGLITSGWSIDGNALQWTVELPPGVTATAWLEGADVRESGVPVGESGIPILENDETGVRVQLGSGRFHFTSTLPRADT